MTLNSTPRTWSAGETVTAAMMNTEVRDAFNGIQAAWTTYTPTLGGITLGNGSLSGGYQRFGKTVHVRSAFTAGSTTTFTASSTLTFSLPVAPGGTYGTGFPLGQAFLLDSSVGSSSRLAGVVCVTGSSVFFVTAKDTSATVTDTNPWTWANGDQILWSATYECA